MKRQLLEGENPFMRVELVKGYRQVCKSVMRQDSKICDTVGRKEKKYETLNEDSVPVAQPPPLPKNYQTPVHGTKRDLELFSGSYKCGTGSNQNMVCHLLNGLKIILYANSLILKGSLTRMGI